MDPEQRTREPRKPIATPGQMITSLLLLLALIGWVVVVMLGFELQDRIDQNFRLIMELAQSAGAS